MHNLIFHFFIFFMLWTVISVISNIILYAEGFRTKLKLNKSLPPNKPIEDFKYEIVNVFEEVGMSQYAVAKCNLITQDKLSRVSILSILCVFLFPYPIIRLEWEYEEEFAFQVTSEQLEKFKTQEDIILY